MATRAAGGSGLSGAAADRYVKDHHDEVDVGLDEQILLNVHDERRMERMVQNRINVPLHQYEFDALVSYAGNPGKGGWPKVVDFVNNHEGAKAVEEMHRHTAKIGDKCRDGLIWRRDCEGRLFLYGKYKS